MRTFDTPRPIGDSYYAPDQSAIDKFENTSQERYNPLNYGKH